MSQFTLDGKVFKVGPRCGIKRQTSTGKWRTPSRAETKKAERHVERCKRKAASKSKPKGPKQTKRKASKSKPKVPKHKPTFSDEAFLSTEDEGITEDENATEDENKESDDERKRVDRHNRAITRYHERYGYDVPDGTYPRPVNDCDSSLLDGDEPDNCWDRYISPEIEQVMTLPSDKIQEIDGDASDGDVDNVHHMPRLRVARKIIDSRLPKYADCMREGHKCEPDEADLRDKLNDRIHDAIRTRIADRIQNEHDSEMERYYRTSEDHDFSQLIEEDRPLPRISAVEAKYGRSTALEYREVLENVDRSKYDPKFRTDNQMGLMNKKQFQKLLDDLAVLGMSQEEYQHFTERKKRKRSAKGKPTKRKR